MGGTKKKVSKMAYVYRYTDLSDGIIKYVGIVWSENRTLEQRIREHEKDEWCQGTNWKIEFICEDIRSRTDAEYLESHYISLYETGKWFNKNKNGWGISKYLPVNSNWKEYDTKKKELVKKVNYLNEENEKLRKKVKRLNEENKKLREELLKYTSINSDNRNYFWWIQERSLLETGEKKVKNCKRKLAKRGASEFYGRIDDRGKIFIPCKATLYDETMKKIDTRFFDSYIECCRKFGISINNARKMMQGETYACYVENDNRVNLIPYKSMLTDRFYKRSFLLNVKGGLYLRITAVTPMNKK